MLPLLLALLLVLAESRARFVPLDEGVLVVWLLLDDDLLLSVLDLLGFGLLLGVFANEPSGTSSSSLSSFAAAAAGFPPASSERGTS